MFVVLEDLQLMKTALVAAIELGVTAMPLVNRRLVNDETVTLGKVVPLPEATIGLDGAPAMIQGGLLA